MMQFEKDDECLENHSHILVKKDLLDSNITQERCRLQTKFPTLLSELNKSIKSEENKLLICWLKIYFYTISQ